MTSQRKPTVLDQNLFIFFSPQMKCKTDFDFPPNIGPISAVSGPSPLSDYKTTTSLYINWLGNVSYNMCLSLPI